MGLLTCLLLSLLCVQVVLTSAPPEVCRRKRHCPKCPPGEFQIDCKCQPCPPGTFNSDRNCETSCHRCYSDCTADSHLEVIQNCSSTSNIRCECQKGFDCVDRDTVSGNCKTCQILQLRATTASTRTQPCSPPKCGRDTLIGNFTAPESSDNTKNRLIAVLCPLFVIAGVTLVLVFCLRDDTRFKRAVKKLCSVEAKETAHMTSEASSDKHQTVPMATANMGPVHVHNPGTVIFSLLGEFSGQIGETKEGKTDIRQPNEGEEYCTVCQPTPSPTVPLSEEEHPEEPHSVFFPSQEQGKDSRVSIEEQL